MGWALTDREAASSVPRLPARAGSAPVPHASPTAPAAANLSAHPRRNRRGQTVQHVRPTPRRPAVIAFYTRRNSRGQAITETVLALMLLCLVFFALVQIAYLFMNQMIAHHTAYVMGRSYIVGFEHRIVQRAREVGSIGLSGHIVDPPAYAEFSPAQLGAVEPALIRDHLENPGYRIWYQHWPRVRYRLPVLGGEGPARFGVRVEDYPLEMPMHRAYMRGDSIDFGSEATFYNHAGYYLY